MNTPNDLKYTEEHEWIKLEGDVAIVGITDYAQDQLGDVVFVDLDEDKSEVKKGDTFGAVESTKSVSDLYAPVSGEVIERNQNLADAPEKVNEDPYGEGWMIKIRVSDTSQMDSLLSSSDYVKIIEAA